MLDVTNYQIDHYIQIDYSKDTLSFKPLASSKKYMSSNK
jgi:hypothetical protein